MKTLLFIGAGPAQVAGISTAKRMGCRVVAFDGNPKAEGFVLVDDSTVVNITDIPKVTEAAHKVNPDGCLTVSSDVCMPAVAAVNDALKLPGLSIKATALATDKGLLRQRLAEYGVPGPSFVVLSSANELENALTYIGLPAVIKPTDNAGSRGVTYVGTRDEAHLAFSRAIRYSRSGRIIVEEFMPGREVSAEAFVANGRITILSLSDKDRTPPPYLLDTRVVFPASWPKETERAIREVVLTAIRVTELDNCPIHMELMITDGGPKVVELAARGPGFKVYTDMIPHVTGVNPMEAQVRLLLGQHVDLRPRRNPRGACLQFFGSDMDGIVVRVVSPDVRDVNRHVDYAIYVDEGDPVRALTCGDDRLGHVIALAETRDEAVAIVETIVGSTIIEIN